MSDIALNKETVPSGSWFGIGLVLLVATSFAVNSTLARLAYEDGSNALTVNMVRMPVAAAALWILLRRREGLTSLPPRDRIIALALGLLVATYAFCLYEAIETIPVALGVLVFYTYPLLTGAASWATGDERPSRRGLLALGAAFAGLALALDAPQGNLDRRGLALAAMAAICFTVLLLLNARLFRGRDTRPVTLHMLAMASLVYAVASIGFAGAAWPATLSGWLALSAVPVFYAFAMTGFWAAVGMIGPIRTSLVMNMEPVSSLILSWLVLGQRLAPVQLVGVALVVGAILFAQRRPNSG